MGKFYHPTVRNVLVNSEHYGSILKEYNKRFALRNGKVNNKEFFESVVKPLIPSYSLMSWYQFLRKWKDSTGITAMKVPLLPQGDAVEQTEAIKANFLNNELATRKGLNAALNAGAAYINDLFAKYNLDSTSLTPQESRILSDAMFKAMKAQDSRIHALGKVREDGREQAKFDHAFNDSTFE